MVKLEVIYMAIGNAATFYIATLEIGLNQQEVLVLLDTLTAALVVVSADVCISYDELFKRDDLDAALTKTDKDGPSATVHESSLASTETDGFAASDGDDNFEDWYSVSAASTRTLYGAIETGASKLYKTTPPRPDTILVLESTERVGTRDGCSRL